MSGIEKVRVRYRRGKFHISFLHYLPSGRLMWSKGVHADAKEAAALAAQLVETRTNEPGTA